MPCSAPSLAALSAPPSDPSPVPAGVVHDRSGGYRAHVTAHALRRFADRVMGLEPALEGLTNREALQADRGLGYDLDGVTDWLAYYGYPGPRWAAKGVIVGRVGLVLGGSRVVTVVMRGA